MDFPLKLYWVNHFVCYTHKQVRPYVRMHTPFICILNPSKIQNQDSSACRNFENEILISELLAYNPKIEKTENFSNLK